MIMISRSPPTDISRQLLRLVAPLVSLLLIGCGSNGSPAIPPKVATEAPPVALTPAKIIPLTDRAQLVGLDFTYRNGSEAGHCTILESLGGGLGWLDYDRDGWLDLIATGGGTISKDKSISGLPTGLFRSLGGQQFVAVSQVAAIESKALYSHGVAIADFDHDAFADVLITGYGTPQLWRNMGDGTFIDIALLAGVTSPLWGSSAGWADLNADGHLDLYLAHYVNWSFENHPFCLGTDAGDRDICPPRSFDALPHAVYYSRGDGTFEDATARAGLRPDGKGLGALLADVEPDGDVDIYVANDTTDNFLYVNDGRGQFEEVGMARGVALDDDGVPNGSMGVDLCDFNQDGRPDLWVANYELETFAMYRNEGRGNFLHVSQGLGITDLGGLFVGFGTACEDFDSDGDQDIVVANGHVIIHTDASPRRQLPLLLAYNGKRFERTLSAPGSYFGDAHEGRGLATADYDADGDVDMAISHLNEPLALLENEFHQQNRWLSLELVGTHSNRDAVGARIELQIGPKRIHRQIIGGGSYLSHSSRAVHFALPQDDGPRTLVVRWPMGNVQTIDARALAGPVTLVEPLQPGEPQPRCFIREVGR
jgi:hypothetical protein